MKRGGKSMVTSKQENVLLVDMYPVVRLGLKQMIDKEVDLRVCGEADSVETGFAALESLKPDVVILDLALKGASGIELIKRIKQHYSLIPVLVFSLSHESLYAERSLRAGARGYLMKSASGEEIITAIRTLLSQEIYVSGPMGSRMLSKFVEGRPATSSPIDRLSNRELEVFQLIGQGLGTRQIAEKLHLSIKTIESYRAHIKDKLNLGSAMELVHHAIHWQESHESREDAVPESEASSK